MLGRRIKRGKGLQNEAWGLFWVERSRKASNQVMCEQTLLKEVGSGQYRCSGEEPSGQKEALRWGCAPCVRGKARRRLVRWDGVVPARRAVKDEIRSDCAGPRVLS